MALYVNTCVSSLNARRNLDNVTRDMDVTPSGDWHQVFALTAPGTMPPDSRFQIG